MTEEDEEPAVGSQSSGLDWEKLFKMAEDPDMEDIIRGPLETAIKNLTDGKAVQKMHAIRNFPDLITSHGEEAIDKLLPAIQKALRSELEDLDIHCEAAVVFKSILQNDKLCNMYPGLSHSLLQSVLDNISFEKEQVSTAAWLETLVDIADRVSLDAVKQYIVPVVHEQAESVQRVQRRVIATKLLHKLAEILPASDVRKELGPCTQMLCQDSNTTVRSAMVQRLPVIAKALKNPTDVVSLLLPCYVQLCKDDEDIVKEASFNNLALCLPHFTKDAKRSTIFPLIKKSADQCIEKKADILMIITKNFGEWVHMLKEVLDQLDLSWVLNTYLKIAGLSSTASEDTTSSKTLMTMCRRMSAYNLPCMVELFPKAFDRILPIFESFCKDTDDEVRVTMAASFHEILTRYPDRYELLPPFMELIRGGASEVVSKITRNLDKSLPLLYKLTTKKESTVSQVQLDRILIGCNQLLRGTGAWRGHEALLKNLVVLRDILNYKELHDSFVPILQREVLHVRAIPCRIAAASTLLHFMRQHPEKAVREKIIDFFKTEIAENKCCYRRALFLDIALLCLRIFSRRFFVEHFLVDIIQLTHDPVSNIRVKAVRLLPIIKTILVLPDDDQTLLNLEKAVRDTLKNEKHNNTRQLMQAAACELSRSESMQRGDADDQKKMKEEDELWDEKRLNEPEHSQPDSPIEPTLPPKPSGLRPPDTTREVSPWRQQRRIVAIVRPQPVVVFRSASPVPRISDGGRPSRLPLSTASREKETLKRATIESALPRPTGRSSSTSRNIMSTSASELTSAPPSYGLRRSATATTGFGISSSSQHSYPLSNSRSSSCLRRPTFGLSRVSSQSTFERKPPQMSVRIKDT